MSTEGIQRRRKPRSTVEAESAEAIDRWQEGIEKRFSPREIAMLLRFQREAIEELSERLEQLERAKFDVAQGSKWLPIPLGKGLSVE